MVPLLALSAGASVESLRADVRAMSNAAEARESRYQQGKRAEAEVLRRVTKALDRINVASQADNPAQFLHAVHYLQRGWTGSFSPENDSLSLPPESPEFQLSDLAAEQLALALHSMFQLAKNAKWTAGQVG